MQINLSISQNFKSQANPVTPFIVKTKRGKLKVSEATKKDFRQSKFVENLAKFYSKNFASLTEDPYWKAFLNVKNPKYRQIFDGLVMYYNNKLSKKDEDLTLLLAKDKRNKIQGACLAYGYDEIPGLKKRVYYLDSIAVNSSFRGFNIGKMLLQKSIKSLGSSFTDVFLVGEKLATGFYEKMGFKPLQKQSESQANLINCLSQLHMDYPMYVEFLTKPVDDSAKRWYELF